MDVVELEVVLVDVEVVVEDVVGGSGLQIPSVHPYSQYFLVGAQLPQPD